MSMHAKKNKKFCFVGGEQKKSFDKFFCIKYNEFIQKNAPVAGARTPV